MQAHRVFFVRHGEYGHRTGLLTERGEEHAREAAKELIQRGLGEAALVHSSSHPRAMETAIIIAEALGAPEPLADKTIAIAGETPDAVLDLNELLPKAIGRFGLTLTDRDLVVVAHMPLISYLEHGDQYEPVGYGHVHEYSGRWTPTARTSLAEALALDEALKHM